MVFKEKQSFWSWWMVILLSFLLLSTLNFEWDDIKGGDFKELSVNPGFWIISIIIIIFSFIKLKTIINSEGIMIQFFPFLLKSKFIPWSEVEQIYVKDYNPIYDYGGWGYRIGKRGKAYNTKGSNGLQLILKNGSRLLIGTQKKFELINIVSKVNQEILNNDYE
jgi:hypothetical protein